jgi:hypothetical protein
VRNSSRTFSDRVRFRELWFEGDHRAAGCRKRHPVPLSQEDWLVAMVDTAWYYLAFYRQTLFRAWDNLTPMQYVSILITIAVVGYMSMKSVGHK